MNLSDFRNLALSLPETAETPHFHLSSFRVRGKIFATVPPQNTHAHIMVGDVHREPALALHSECLEKLFWGRKVVGLRVKLAEAPAGVVEDLLKAAWAAKAPKSLLERR